MLEGLGRVVDRGGAGADHADGLAGKAGEVDRIARVRAPFASNGAEQLGYELAAETVAAVRQYHPPRRDAADACGVSQGQHHMVRTAIDVRDLAVVLDRHRHHPAIPAQVVHPLRTGYPVKPRPCLVSELRLVPGAEGQARKAERRSGQLRRRAQYLHARVCQPRPLVPFGTAIEECGARDAQASQCQGRREPGHAGADDCHVEHRSMVGM